ncbi:MAG: hypothetical protein ACI8SK_001035 [Shewanella sp.]|jgi:hypothetical protein
MNNHDKRLDNMISNLPKTLTPESDLWGSIERQLDAPETKPKNHWRTLAVASVIALCLLLGQQVLYPDHVNPDTNQVLLASIEDIQIQHANQVAELQLLAQKTNWQSSPFSSPAETGIKQLREAATLIYQSLKLNPTDQQLWQLWLWTHSREIELLSQAQALPLLQDSNGDII